MTCGSCNYTSGDCYYSMPPKVRCIVTGEYHLYSDECNCTDTVASRTRAAELGYLAKRLNEPGALAAISIERDKAPVVETKVDPSICQEDIEKYLTAPICAHETGCLICDTAMQYLGVGPLICNDCRKVINFIKEKFKEELSG